MADICEELTAPRLGFALRLKRDGQFSGAAGDLIFQRLPRLAFFGAMG